MGKIMANKIITSPSNLVHEFEKRIKYAMQMTEKQIFEVLSRKIYDYYTEKVFMGNTSDVPQYYERTNKLINSLKTTDVLKISNGYFFKVGFDNEYLTFKYPGNSGTSYSGLPDIKFTGLDVLESLDNELHGGNVKGKHRFWTEAIEEINREYNGLDGLFLTNCRISGLNINTM